ncbi:MAG: glycosyltransferase family 2 protein [Deltaproteobacteria bacterium]|nr:glycosyltransferase family 2 protein [Deltaproteobacteria bacterium]
MGQSQIIAVVLIKNEDLFIETVLRNILDFCDRIFVADHHSTDQTAEIVQRLAAVHPKVNYRVVDHPSESHDLIADFANEPNWIMGVDGDEVYDPEGLRHLRADLLTGRYDDHFKVLGNVLNVRFLDRQRHMVRGYLSPPCRSMTKLYNFGAIKAWPPPCPERLHGGQIEFKPGYSYTCVRRLLDEVSWEESPFRCLHLCFTYRSSLDLIDGDQAAIRKGVGERKLWMYNFRSWLMSFFGREDIPYYKRNFYMRGPLMEKDTHIFGL